MGLKSSLTFERDSLNHLVFNLLWIWAGQFKHNKTPGPEGWSLMSFDNFICSSSKVSSETFLLTQKIHNCPFLPKGNQCLPISAAFASLRTSYSRVTQQARAVPECFWSLQGSDIFLLLQKAIMSPWYIPQTQPHWFIHSPIHSASSCFPFLTCMNKTAISILSYVSEGTQTPRQNFWVIETYNCVRKC